MIKVNLKKELEQINKSELTKSEEFVKEVKMLMENNSEKEKDILKELNLGSNIIKAEEETARMITFNEINTKYEGEVYTIAQIKHLAIKYNLRFLQTNHFKGHVPPELGSILLRFCEKNKFEARNERENFYILAPKEMFNLSKRPKDPLLFYRINNRNGETMYKLVHKWSEDFTIGRRISGIINQSEKSIYLAKLIKNTILCILLIIGLKLIANTMGIELYIHKNNSFLFEFSQICIGIIWLIRCVYFTIKYSDSDYFKYSSEKAWSSEYYD